MSGSTGEVRGALPRCAQHQDAQYRVVKDGSYGRPPRQRYRCISPDGAFHRFTPTLPRLLAVPGLCEECDHDVDRSQGAVTARKYRFPIRAISSALVAVGQGASYTDAAAIARATSHFPGGAGGGIVAQWIDVFAPLILQSHAESAWPECLMLEAIRLPISPSRSPRSKAVYILCGYGRQLDEPTGRMWALAARPTLRSADWVNFLADLDRSRPPKWLAAPHEPVALLAAERVGSTQTAVAAERRDWPRVTRQVPAADAEAMAASIAMLRRALNSRLRTLHNHRHNQRRTNIALGLMRLHLNGVASERHYYTTLRAALAQSNGRVGLQRSGYQSLRRVEELRPA
jgi:hypothetical protein